MKTLKISILLLFMSSSLTNNAQIISKLFDGMQPKPPKPKEIKGDDISGPLHQKYMGKIVFSKKTVSLVYKKENESEFQNDFELSEPIYLRAYYDNTLYNHIFPFAPRSESESYIISDAYFNVKFYLDEVLILENRLDTKTNNIANKDNDKDMVTMRTTFDDALKTAERSEWFRFKEVYQRFIKKCDSNLTIGKHIVRIEIYAAHPKVAKIDLLATGSLTVKINEKSFDPNDEQFCAPKAKMKDTILEAKIAIAFKENNKRAELKEVRISSDKWDILRHPNSGIIIGRILSAYIISKYDGKCEYQKLDFVQDYDGTSYQDKYTRLYKSLYTSSAYDIPCRCIEK